MKKNNIEKQIRSFFDNTIEKELNPEKAAEIEVLREYLLNPGFKKSLEDFIFNKTYHK
jgi:hypothetical protein